MKIGQLSVSFDPGKPQERVKPQKVAPPQDDEAAVLSVSTHGAVKGDLPAPNINAVKSSVLEKPDQWLGVHAGLTPERVLQLVA